MLHFERLVFTGSTLNPAHVALIIVCMLKTVIDYIKSVVSGQLNTISVDYNRDVDDSYYVPVIL